MSLGAMLLFYSCALVLQSRCCNCIALLWSPSLSVLPSFAADTHILFLSPLLLFLQPPSYFTNLILVAPPLQGEVPGAAAAYHH